jgi:hypothetical protein
LEDELRRLETAIHSLQARRRRVLSLYREELRHFRSMIVTVVFLAAVAFVLVTREIHPLRMGHHRVYRAPPAGIELVDAARL